MRKSFSWTWKEHIIYLYIDSNFSLSRKRVSFSYNCHMQSIFAFNIFSFCKIFLYFYLLFSTHFFMWIRSTRNQVDWIHIHIYGYLIYYHKKWCLNVKLFETIGIQTNKSQKLNYSIVLYICEIKQGEQNERT